MTEGIFDGKGRYPKHGTWKWEDGLYDDISRKWRTNLQARITDEKEHEKHWKFREELKRLLKKHAIVSMRIAWRNLIYLKVKFLLKCIQFEEISQQSWILSWSWKQFRWKILDNHFAWAVKKCLFFSQRVMKNWNCLPPHVNFLLNPHLSDFHEETHRL